jgi:hypothetical protein
MGMHAIHACNLAAYFLSVDEAMHLEYAASCEAKLKRNLQCWAMAIEGRVQCCGRTLKDH